MYKTGCNSYIYRVYLQNNSRTTAEWWKNDGMSRSLSELKWWNDERRLFASTYFCTEAEGIGEGEEDSNHIVNPPECGCHIRDKVRGKQEIDQRREDTQRNSPFMFSRFIHRTELSQSIRQYTENPIAGAKAHRLFFWRHKGTIYFWNMQIISKIKHINGDKQYIWHGICYRFIGIIRKSEVKEKKNCLSLDNGSITAR